MEFVEPAEWHLVKEMLHSHVRELMIESIPTRHDCYDAYLAYLTQFVNRWGYTDTLESLGSSGRTKKSAETLFDHLLNQPDLLTYLQNFAQSNRQEILNHARLYSHHLRSPREASE